MPKIYLLNNQKFDNVENIEIFKIEYLNVQIDLSKYDALVFTSKNAVYSLSNITSKWKDIPSFAIAQKTSKIIEEEGGKIEFTGSSGHGNDFAKELIPVLKNRKALYIRAQKVVSNLVQTLKEANISIDEVITYKTVCNEKINTNIEDFSTIIFTSPSSVKCFFKKYSWNNSLKAIAIGQTTAKYLPNYVKFKLSKETSVEECIKLAMVDNF
jgi:uroporphyrinogen-III synthase